MSCSGSSSIDSVKAYAGDAVEFIFVAYDSEITFQITDPAGNGYLQFRSTICWFFPGIPQIPHVFSNAIISFTSRFLG